MTINGSYTREYVCPNGERDSNDPPTTADCPLYAQRITIAFDFNGFPRDPDEMLLCRKCGTELELRG